MAMGDTDDTREATMEQQVASSLKRLRQCGSSDYKTSRSALRPFSRLWGLWRRGSVLVGFLLLFGLLLRGTTTCAGKEGRRRVAQLVDRCFLSQLGDALFSARATEFEAHDWFGWRLCCLGRGNRTRCGTGRAFAENVWVCSVGCSHDRDVGVASAFEDQVRRDVCSGWV